MVGEGEMIVNPFSGCALRAVLTENPVMRHKRANLKEIETMPPYCMKQTHNVTA